MLSRLFQLSPSPTLNRTDIDARPNIGDGPHLSSINGSSGNDFIHVAGDGVASPGPGYTESTLATNGDDFIFAWGGNDYAYGGGGKDQILGDFGDDHLFGGDGDDLLEGQEANDVVYGGADNDGLSDDRSGNDILYGGAGDDQISVRRSIGYAGNWTALLDGGTGNDDLFVIGYPDSFITATIYGGAGDDTISAGYNVSGTIDAGGGNDEVTVGTNVTVTLGAGLDTVVIGPDVEPNGIITDFVPGDAGESVRLLDWVRDSLTGWDETNPFSGGFVRLLQSGNDTILQADLDGPANGASWSNLLTFRNVLASAFTAHNFQNLSPAGDSVQGKTINGTDGSNTITGTLGDDVIHALGGPDYVDGSGGNDTAYGGDGNDFVYGGAGDNIVYGDDGDDTVGNTGANGVAYGGDGDDVVAAGTAASAYGGAGNDTLYSGGGPDNPPTVALVDGGDGDDTFHIIFNASAAVVTADGDGGDDTFDIEGSGTANVYGGDGNDNFVVGATGAQITLSFGAGTDTLRLDPAKPVQAALTITDFAAGDGGDHIDMYDFLVAQLSGWDRTTSPFLLGLVRIAAEGTSSVLQIKAGSIWQDLVTFQNTVPEALTADNFNGWPPDGSPPPISRGHGRRDG